MKQFRAFSNNPKPYFALFFFFFFRSGCLWDLATLILVAVKERHCRSRVLSLRGTCLCCFCIP